MVEASATQSILRRLIEAEAQAQSILDAAKQQSNETVSQATEQAKQSLETARRAMDQSLASRLAAAQAQGAVEMKQRLAQAEAAVRAIEERASGHFEEAVEMVVNFVTNQGG